MTLSHAENSAQHKPAAGNWRRGIERAGPVLLIILLIVLWQILTRAFDIPNFLLPAPTDVARLIVDEWPLIQMHSFATIGSIVSGYVTAVLFALAVSALITKPRPNPSFFRGAMFNFTAIQTGRMLTEDEVLQINLITKRRAYRYIAAADREWLYPERHVSTDHWKKLGGGYLLMPEPRHIHMGGQMMIGYKDGRGDAFSEYGHKPWQRGYKDEERDRRDGDALYRFQAEWALKIHGRKYAATTFEFGGRALTEDSDEMFEHRKEVLAQYGRRAG